MGAGIIPTCIYKNKLYFLLGKENKFNDSPGWADFGGGKEKGEKPFDTALREGYEELAGFLGTKEYLKKYINNVGKYEVTDSIYTSYLFFYPYNKCLEIYYNNFYKCIEHKLDDSVIKSTTIFEKSQIKWVCIDNLGSLKVRPFYKKIVNKIIENKSDIHKFISTDIAIHKSM